MHYHVNAKAWSCTQGEYRAVAEIGVYCPCGKVPSIGGYVLSGVVEIFEAL